jgi:hypothetical protein
MVAPKEVLGKAYELTGPAMLAFPQVITAEAAPGIQGAKPRFSAWLVFDPQSPDLKALYKLAHEVGLLKLPPKFIFCKMPLTPEEEKNPEYKADDNPGRMSPFYLGDRVIANAEAKGKSASGLQFLAGKVALVARSSEEWPPKLASRTTGTLSEDQRLSARSMFYTGALVGAGVYLRVYEAFGGGVSARLNYLYATGEGERVSTGNGSAVPAWANTYVNQNGQVIGGLATALADHLAEF